ncbi:hypothetical protein [Methylobacterium sp. E-066]|uniref:hypothetical protein n=1 Tax=Methylobacterium sp. E-066 TaxID=2836584 RepID=UPI001FBAC589|nr:hypothetical protein [Methylobacterium sp. E-066]MCJ2143879.1 hypothetical protein [Methylobacterium sp. E-066]
MEAHHIISRASARRQPRQIFVQNFVRHGENPESPALETAAFQLVDFLELESDITMKYCDCHIDSGKWSGTHSIPLPFSKILC